MIKNCLYANINKRESTGLKHFNDSKAFIEYSNDMDDIYKIIEEYNPNKKRKILIVFCDMIADILSDKKLNPIVTELFIRGGKLKTSLVSITKIILLAKFYALIYYENSKQMRTSTNCI